MSEEFILSGADSVVDDEYEQLVEILRAFFAPSLENRIHGGLEAFVYSRSQLFSRFPNVERFVNIVKALGNICRFCGVPEVGVIEGLFCYGVESIVKNGLIAAFLNAIVLNNRLNRISRQLDAMGMDRNFLKIFSLEGGGKEVRSCEIGGSSVDESRRAIKRRAPDFDDFPEKVISPKIENSPGKKGVKKMRESSVFLIKSRNSVVSRNFEEKLKLEIDNEINEKSKLKKLELPCKSENIIGSIIESAPRITFFKNVKKKIKKLSTAVNRILAAIGEKKLKKCVLYCKIFKNSILFKLRKKERGGCRSCLFAGRVSTSEEKLPPDRKPEGSEVFSTKNSGEACINIQTLILDSPIREQPILEEPEKESSEIPEEVRVSKNPEEIYDSEEIEGCTSFCSCRSFESSKISWRSACGGENSEKSESAGSPLKEFFSDKKPEKNSETSAKTIFVQTEIEEACDCRNRENRSIFTQTDSEKQVSPRAVTPVAPIASRIEKLMENREHSLICILEETEERTRRCLTSASEEIPPMVSSRSGTLVVRHEDSTGSGTVEDFLADLRLLETLSTKSSRFCHCGKKSKSPNDLQHLLPELNKHLKIIFSTMLQQFKIIFSQSGFEKFRSVLKRKLQKFVMESEKSTNTSHTCFVGERRRVSGFERKSGRSSLSFIDKTIEEKFCGNFQKKVCSKNRALTMEKIHESTFYSNCEDDILDEFLVKKSRLKSRELCTCCRCIDRMHSENFRPINSRQSNRITREVHPRSGNRGHQNRASIYHSKNHRESTAENKKIQNNCNHNISNFQENSIIDEEFREMLIEHVNLCRNVRNSLIKRIHNVHKRL